MMPKFPIRFCGTGAYVPKEILTNEHFAKYLDTSDDWIVTRTGIRARRRAAPDEYTSVLAIHAAKAALERADMTIDDIDVIIVATASPDNPVPSTAAAVQAGLGANDTPAFDVCAACAGFLYGSVVASGLLASGLHKRALVIGAETLTRQVDPQDRTMAVLFGDGSGAAILGPAERPDQGILFAKLGCDGTKYDYIWTPGGGSHLPASEITVAERLHFMRMRGREVFKFAVNKMRELIREALETTGLSPDDLKLIIPHQSNLRIIESMREKLDLPKEKVAVNIDRFGNTSAASVIMSLDEHLRKGTLQEGDLVLLIAIGAGLSWGTMIVRL